MAFDPSVISSIPDSQINPIKAKGDAYTLASLIDNQQLDRMKLNSAKSEQADLGKIKQVLGKSDISTFEGQQKAAEAATRINPKLGMDLQRNFAQRQSAQYDKQDQELKIQAVQHDYIAGALDTVLAEADQLRKSGATDAMVNATIMKSVLGAKEQLSKQTLPNGQPVWSANYDKALAAGPLTYDRIKALEMQSNKGQELMKQRLAERHQQVGEAQETERERHDRAMESQGQQKVDVSKTKSEEGKFGDKESQLLGALAERGVSLPAGLRSKAQQIATMQALIKRNPDQSPDQIADKIKSGQIDFGAEKKETQIAAGIAGKIRYAEEEINRLVPLVKQASDAVPRGQFVPWNRLKLYGESQISDPNLKKLKAYMTTLANSYDVLAARGGTDMEKRKHNREMFDAADSPQALQAAMDAVLTEARVSGEAAAASVKPRSATVGVPKPYDDAEKEKRYQDWKKAHGGG